MKTFVYLHFFVHYTTQQLQNALSNTIKIKLWCFFGGVGVLGESSVVCRDVNSKILKIRANQRLQVSFHATPGEWGRKYAVKDTSAVYITLASIVGFSMVLLLSRARARARSVLPVVSPVPPTLLTLSSSALIHQRRRRTLLLVHYTVHFQHVPN